MKRVLCLLCGDWFKLEEAETSRNRMGCCLQVECQFYGRVPEAWQEKFQIAFDCLTSGAPA